MTPVPEAIWQYFDAHGRHDLPWRLPEADGSFDPYRIMVSEIMLQQTQVSRVIPKYLAFLTRFPTVAALAASPLADVLVAWSGLGYNRRAKFLWQAARSIMDEYGGSLPITVEELVRLPGIGINTAGAIAAYAYNRPVLFIETNIRTVYIYHYFQNEQQVTDKMILEKLQETLPADQPRLFYWALMDYGTHLKATVGNLNRASKTYAKQSRFEGSVRQVRGSVIRALGTDELAFTELAERINDQRLEAVLDSLVQEGLIRRNADKYRL